MSKFDNNNLLKLFIQKRFSSLNEFDTLSKVHGQLDELKDIMVRNIGKETNLCYYLTTK